MLREALALIALATLAACTKQDCSTQTDCDLGYRCELPAHSTHGTCVACESVEIPYDGIDNDCDPNTPDNDLDGDGENWIGAAVNAGTDCDDHDREIGRRLHEICNDHKDNNCNGEIDEVACMDKTPPVISITAPRNSELITADFEVTVEATDDIGVAEVDLYADNHLLHTLLQAPYIFTVNPGEIADGRVQLRAEAIDLAGRTASDSVTIVLDEQTPPDVAVTKPLEGRAYDGALAIEFRATDQGAGVATVTADIDGTALELPRRQPFQLTVDTTPMPEGPHTLAIHATDRANHAGTTLIHFQVDRTGPALTFREPAAGAIIAGPTTVTLEANDEGGIAQISFSRTTTLTAQTSTTVLFTTTLDAAQLPVGPYTLTARAIDATIVDDVEGHGHATTATLPVIADNGTLLPCTATRPLPFDTVSVSGTTQNEANDYEGGCFAAGAPDVAYDFTAPADLALLTVSAAGSAYPVALHAYRGFCGPAFRIGCVPNPGPLSIRDVRAGDRIIIIVDGSDANAAGAFTLSVQGQIAAGQACDPLDTALSCQFGTCADDGAGGFACPGADCADGFDNDEDGRVDENACVAPPQLTCPSDQVIPLLDTTPVTATADGMLVERRWELTSAPLGSTIRPAPPDQASTAIHPLLVGPYTLRHTVLSRDFEFSSCEVTLRAHTDDRLRVELVWNTDVRESADHSDLDLHLLHPDASEWFLPPLDCYALNRTPAWGAAGANDDPRIDVDDSDGRGPESIGLRTPQEGRPYRIGVHYYLAHAFGPASAIVNVYCDDMLEQSFGPVTLVENELWRVADVSFAPRSCTVVPLSAPGGLPLITQRGEPNGSMR